MSAESVKVLVRCRPVNQREMSLGGKTVVTMDPARGQCSIVNPADLKAAPKTFTFDGAYGMDSTTEQIYSEIVFPLVENVLEGYNGTVFAYGQTGSGKSFSMQGPEGVPVQKGVIPRTFEHIFEATATTENMKFLVCASYLEIYNEEVRDLLGRDIKQKLEIKEHPEKGIYVAGLSMHTVNNIKECDEFMQKGLKSRATGSTLMNADSSRSHSIFTVHLEMMETRDDGEHIKTTKLHLVDLAGSERQAKTGATGERLKEATKINLSLSALGNVISALVDGKSSHIPYRDSKLTRLLQDSLGGNTKTIMIACLSPADNNYDESLSTLRYANRAKNIKNKPKINEDPKDALLREYQEEIKRLKSIIGGGGEGGVPAAVDPEALEKEKQKIKEEYQTEVENLKKQYKEEQVSKSKLQEEMSKLKKHFEEQITNVGQKSPKKTGMMAPSSSPTHGMSTDTQAEEALKKLEMLQQKMVGGEQVNNEALKQQRKRKKTEAEKRKQKLAEALLKIDSDDPMMQVYTSVQEKLDAVNKQYEKEKKKSKSLEGEIRDLQSEFELDRIDYLDTIRRQDQQLKLLQQILDKVQPCLRRDSNYANLEKIKKEAQWDEDLQKWHLPEVTVVKTQFPNGNLGGAGGVMQGGRQPNHASVSPRISNGYQGAVEDADDDRLRSKLEASSAENIAGNYFKPVRSTNIMSKTEQDKNRNIGLPEAEI